MKYVLLLAVWLTNSLLPLTLTAGEPAELKAIVEAARSYLAAQSAITSPAIKVEAVKGNFARVSVVPRKGETDPSTLFLTKKNGAWAGVLLGTAFAPEDYDELSIPANIRIP